jgi:hypothetical protein
MPQPHHEPVPEERADILKVRPQGALFRILPTDGYDAEDEEWAFPPGTVVRGAIKILEGKERLVAIEAQ